MILILILGGPFTAEQSCSKKTDQRMDFTGIEIVWNNMKPKNTSYLGYFQRKKLNILGDF